MTYSIQKTDAQSAIAHAKEYTYALVYMMSRMILCRTKDLPQLDWAECLEARFFDADGELHIYEEDGYLQAVKIADKTEQDPYSCLTRKYQLADRYHPTGHLLYVREYLDYDEHGQVYVSLTRLAGIGEA